METNLIEMSMDDSIEYRAELYSYPPSDDELDHDYLWAAFHGMDRQEQRRRLLALADGKYEMKSHWPLFLRVFFGISVKDRNEWTKLEGVTDACVKIFHEFFPDSLKAYFKDKLSYELDQHHCETEWKSGIETDVFVPPLFNTIQATFGRLEKIIRQHEFNPPEYFKLTHLFGCRKFKPFKLTLDFRDCVTLRRRIPEDYKGAVADPLGLYRKDGDANHVVLFLDCIRKTAVSMGCFEHVHELTRIVFIHELAHVLHLGETDWKGRPNPRRDDWIPQEAESGKQVNTNRQGNYWVEFVAQYATWLAIQDNPLLLKTFEALSEKQSLEYRTWKGRGRDQYRNMKEFEFRFFLSFLRSAEKNNCGKPLKPDGVLEGSTRRLDLQNNFSSHWDLPPIQSLTKPSLLLQSSFDA